MSGYSRILSATAVAGVIVFFAVVLLLHLAQPEYDAKSQFMSELALGRFGGWLLVAFLGLSIATAATAANVRAHQSPLSLAVLLGIAAACFLAAGVVTLAASAQVHVWLVATAFVLCGLGMYLLPRHVVACSRPGSYVASWGSGLVMCGATGLGGTILVSGVAQRISAFALLFWLTFVAWRLARGNR